MSTLTPTLTLTGTAADFGANLALSVTDSLALATTSIVHNSQEVMGNRLHTVIASAGTYSKSYVFLKNTSATAAEIITVTAGAFTHSDIDYNNATGLTDITGIHGVKVGMNVYHGVEVDHIPIGATVTEVSSATNLVLSAATTDGDNDNQTLTFATSIMTLGPEEFAYFPWSGSFDLGAHSASGTPTLEVRIFQA